MSVEKSNGSIHIREAVVDDVPIILQFIKGLAAFEKLSDKVNATQAGLSETLFGDRAYATVLLAERSGVPVGFLLYFNNYSTFLGKPGIYIEGIFVLPEERGRGVGKAFMKYCARLVQDKGWGRIEWAVLHWNPAREFYERLGGEPLDDWILYRLAGERLGALADP